MQGKRFNALLKMHEQLDKAGFSPDKQGNAVLVYFNF
jgi:hypothetical protein